MWSKRKRKVIWMRILKRMSTFNDYIFPREKLDNEKRMGLRIFERAVRIKDADIFMSPLSDTIYIEINEIYLILEGCDLQIINGKFQYDLRYSVKDSGDMKKQVFTVLEKRRIEVEERIRTKNDRTLNSILQEITDLKEGNFNFPNE